VYSLLISAALALSVFVSLLVFPEKPAWFFAFFFAIIAFIPTLMLLSRKIGEKVRPFFETAQQQTKSGNIPLAIETLEKAKAWSRWQLFLGQQVDTEIGLLHYATGNEKQAIEHLRKGYARMSHGHLILAAALYRDGKYEEAIAALEYGIKFNKKSPILYNVAAWMHEEKNKRDVAIEMLARGLKADPGDETTADNLQRLQNDKKLNMRPFADLWFMLKFETPKGMQAAQPAFRKGFRQPPKAAKGRRR
jgi:tetratricopeptide (TPR) repeat protein